MTITLQIGNSDDKLTQDGWHNFVLQTRNAVELAAISVHFFGCSVGWERWQNACWVFKIDPNDATILASKLKEIRKMFNQDSVGWTEGDTIFI